MIVDDISTIRELTTDVRNKEVHFFPLQPMTLTTGDFGGGGTNVQGVWSAPNAPSIKPFYYYLKDRVATGDVRVEILDKDGKLVQSLPGTKRKGINKIFWNQRGKGPKTAAGTKPDRGSFVSPQVLPGTYTAKLKVGTQEYTQPLEIRHDAASAFTEADRRKQYAASMELAALHESLAKLVDSVNSKLKVQKALLDKETNAKSKKKLQENYDKLEALRGELVPTKQTTMFADETRLRDEITDVYTAICFNESAPSNLQLQRIEQLKGRVKEAEARYLKL
jgi:hypothetical protein